MATIVSLRPVKRLLDVAAAFALPPRCPGCGVVVESDHSFCLGCWTALDFLGGPACSRCAEPLELAHDDAALCGACLADPPPFESLRAAVSYGPIARALALKLKHGGRPGIAITMARLMRRRAGDMVSEVLVAPVPLHRRRLWSRGYNQSALIARALLKLVPGTLAVDLIERSKPTPMLRGLGRKARARAVAGAFRIPGHWQDRLKGARVLLIDDVHTTGATVQGCARILRRAGAREVRVLCWARVIRDAADEPQQALTSGDATIGQSRQELNRHAEDRYLHQDDVPLLRAGEEAARRQGRRLRGT